MAQASNTTSKKTDKMKSGGMNVETPKKKVKKAKAAAVNTIFERL